MEEIKEKEYIRTDKGTIARIEDLDWDILYSVTEMKPKYKHWVSKEQCYTEYIVKHSPNIRDLIEEGDYVNGKEILEIKQNVESGLRYLMYSYVPMKYYVERRDEIKSIVTKQQFNQMKYIVGE